MKIKTLDNLNATVEAPPSKSYTHRALFCAALADGVSRIRSPLICDDTKVTIGALKSFGVGIRAEDDTLLVEDTTNLKAPKRQINIRDSGTTMRFFISFASLASGVTRITGSKRAKERPNKDLIVALETLGAKIKSKNGHLPVSVKGPLSGGSTSMSGESSSQFFSSILLAAPYAKSGVTIRATGEIKSRPYIDATLDVMRRFGISVQNADYKSFAVPVSEYHPTNYSIEGDFSNASYFFAAAAITDGRVKVRNLNPASLQGDKKFLHYMQEMGCTIIVGRDWIELVGNGLCGINVDMGNAPDIVPTLAVVAAFADGKTTIRNISHLSLKESDRANAVLVELRKLGCNVHANKDELVIQGGGKLHGAKIETYNDHRIAMAFSIAGLRVSNVKISNPGCVSKSFPGFFEKLEGLYV